MAVLPTLIFSRAALPPIGPTLEALTSTRSWPLWLIVLAGAVVLYGGYRLGKIVGARSRTRVAHEGSRRALAGKTAEQWAPYLEGFPGLPSEARFLGAPIDYVIFDGSGDGEIREILFVEVKSGSGKLTKVERSLRDCVEQGRVYWVEHRVDPPSVG